jgi:hypothetical protein
VSSLDGHQIPPKEERFMPRALKLWGVLASICLVATILLANAFPLSWTAVWPGAFSLIPDAVLMYYLSLPVFKELKNLSAVCWKLVRSRRYFEEGVEGYTSSLDFQLDGLEGELDQLRIIAAELDWKVKVLPKRPARRGLSPI